MMILKSVYGLFAVSDDPHELSENLSAYFEENISGTFLENQGDEETRAYLNSIRSMFSDPENISFDNLVALKNESFDIAGVDNAVISNPAVLENQITEYMKYLGPVSIGRGILSKISAFKNISGQTKVVNAKIDYNKSQGEIQKKFDDIYAAVNGYNEMCDQIRPEECLNDIQNEINAICSEVISIKKARMQNFEDQCNESLKSIDDRLDVIRNKINEFDTKCSEAAQKLNTAAEYTGSSSGGLISCIDEIQRKGQAWSDCINELESGELRDTMQSDYDSTVNSADRESIQALHDTLEQRTSQLEEIKNMFTGLKLSGTGLNDNRGDTQTVADQISEFITDDEACTITPPQLAQKVFGPCDISSFDGRVGSSDDFYRYLCSVCSQSAAQERQDSQAQKIRDKIDSFADTSKITGSDLSEASSSSISSNISNEMLESIIGYPGDDDGQSLDSQDNCDNGDDNEILDNQQKMLDNSSASLSDLGDLAGEITGAGVRKLYFSEYATEMFSCYTCDKKSDGAAVHDIQPQTLSGIDISPENNVLYKSEAEYILWGNDDMKKNHQYTNALIFGTRFVSDTMYAYTDAQIKTFTLSSAAAIAGWTGFGVPVVQNVLMILPKYRQEKEKSHIMT